MNLRPVDFRTERERIWMAIGEKTGVEIDIVEQPDPWTLRRRLLDGGYHVLHFIGHGGFDNETGEGSLAFVASDGEDQYVPGDRLADHVKGTELQVVVLSSCYGATLPRRRGQSVDAAVAPALLRAGVPAVVAMQFPISDAAAIAFSETFYKALAHEDDIDVAVFEGRLGVSTEAKASLEWATPALFLRVTDGKLFSFAEPAASRFQDASADSVDASWCFWEELTKSTKASWAFQDGRPKPVKASWDLQDGCPKLVEASWDLQDGCPKLVEASWDLQDGCSRPAKAFRNFEDGCSRSAKAFRSFQDGRSKPAKAF